MSPADSDARPHPPVPEHSAEVQRVAHAGVFEGEERGADSPGTDGAPSDDGVALLVDRVLAQHRGCG